MILTTFNLSFAHDSSVQSTIKRWNKLTNPNANNERQPSDIHIIKKYYDSLLSQNTSSIKNVITIPHSDSMTIATPHSDSMTIATLYEQLLHTKISDSVLTSHERNEVINNTLNIVLQLGLPDDIINPDWVQLVGDKNKHISLDYYYDANCHEVNKQYDGKFGKISFMYSVLEKNVHIVTDESNIETVLKRWNKSTNPYWCNDRKQNDADIVKKYYDCVISQSTKTIKTIINITHSDSIKLISLYEQSLRRNIDSSVINLTQVKDIVENTFYIVSQLGLPDTINDRSFISIRKDKVVSFCYFFDIYCNEDNKNPIKLGQISFRYNITKRTFEPDQIWAFGG